MNLNSMNNGPKESFLSLPARLKPLYLAALIHGLTISAREYRGPEPDRDLVYEKLICINEVIHQISSKLRAIVENDETQYPDDVFFDILFEKAGERFGPQLEAEMVRTLQNTVKKAKGA
jgi:hypothetical protein